MYQTNWRRPALLLLVTSFIISGCIQLPLVPASTTDELSMVLSDVVFDPNVTCDELRRAFDVEYLPDVSTPDEVGVDYEEHWLPTDDGKSLRVWYLRTSLNRGLVVLSAGAYGEMACYLFHAQLLVDRGWEVVMYEYRGIGGSDGDPDISRLEGDLAMVVNWTRDYTAHDQVTLMGISLGTIPSVAVAVAQPEEINGVILDSPVAMGAMFERLQFALRSQTQTLIDLLAPDLVSEDLVERLYQPLLIFVGEKDRLTPLPMAELLYDRAAGPKEIVRFPGVGHAREPFRDTGAYIYYLETFLSSVWSQYVPLEVDAVNAEGG
jgi:pimeloyl-ACP methyl ester carboxylesterase